MLGYVTSFFIRAAKPLDVQLRGDLRAVAVARKELDQTLYVAEGELVGVEQEIRGAATKFNNKRKIIYLCKKYAMKLKQIDAYQRRETYLEKLKFQIETIQSNVRMIKTMKRTSEMMTKMDLIHSMPKLEGMINEYEKASMQLNDYTDKMDMAMDGAVDETEFMDDSDNIIAFVMDKLGMKELEGFVDAPKGRAVHDVSEERLDAFIAASGRNKS
jgi:hypothetical protein